MPTPFTADRALESLLARVLHYGTWLAMVVITVGIGMTTFGDAALTPAGGTTVVAAGLALLILLPVVRVALMLIVFVLGQEYFLAAVAGFVLLIILIGLLVGTHGSRRAAVLTQRSAVMESGPAVASAAFVARSGASDRFQSEQSA